MITTETAVPFLATGSPPIGLTLHHNLWNTAPRRFSQFGIAHNNYGIWLTFDVFDTFLHSKKRRFNDDVHQDNCVEFFFRFPGDINYYNFEFNCMGSIKAAYGPDRFQRDFLPEDTLKCIEQNMEVSISNQNETGLINWQISLYIGLSEFCFNSVSSLKNLTCEANFTKCGDMLTQPNYFSWAYIDTPTPDFHRPEFFGQVYFL